MRLYKQRGYWYIDVRVAGNRRRRLSLKTKNRSLAESKASRLAPYSDGNLIHRPLPDLIAEYRRYCDRTHTTKTVRGNLARWQVLIRNFEILGIIRLDQLDRATVSRLRDELWAKNLSNATVNRYMSIIFSFLRWCHETGHFPELPQFRIRKLPEQRGIHRRVFSPQEVSTLSSASAIKEFGLFIELLSLTGCRCDEIRLLKCRNVDLDRREIRLEKTKTHQARTVPLTDRGVELCLGLIGKPESFLFEKGGKPRWTQNAAIQAFSKLTKTVGVKGTLHDLRSTFVSRLLDNGVGLKTIQELIGDKTARMVMEVYAQTVSGSAREAVDRLSK